jgi:aminopeptidase N
VCGESSVVDVLHHAVELTASESGRTLTGRGEIELRALKTTSTLTLDAHDLRVTQASLDAPLRFTQGGETLCVELPQPLAAGAISTLHFSWKVGGKRAMPQVGNDQVWAGYDAAAWMPTRQDSAERATLELTIVAPRNWKVIGPGTRATARKSGPTPLRPAELAASTFVVTQPTPPFLFAFAAGSFDEAQLEVDGVTLRALGPRGADLASVLKITAPMLRFMARRAGPAPMTEYTQVFVEGDAAQEAAGFALLSAAAIEDVAKDPQADWIFIHELAHQWFGWQVACTDFNDFWLNEGFATFFTAAYKQERWGPPAYAELVESWRERSAKVHAEGRDAPVARSAPGRTLPSPKDAELQARGITYSRGALVLDKLRSNLGEEAFWSGIRSYATSRAWKGARTDDLRSALEAASGKDLNAFFAAKVYAAAPGL